MGMTETAFDVPVVMIVYKRLDVTEKSFAPIRELKPQKLYIISDGPRKPEEAEAVEAVRSYIDSHIDWPCEVHRDYAEKNMGLRYRMPSGMAWVFENEDRAIFIEDDIEATQNFFYFCRDMLKHYENDERIAMITGSNLYPEDPSFNGEDICFSAYATIWGWATWKRAFKLYDVNIRRWPELKKKQSFRNVMTDRTWNFFSVVFDDLQYHWYRTWGYQWDFLLWANEKLGIVPKYNLISNIGMGNEQGEHPGDTAEKVDYISSVKKKELALPIRYPAEVKRNEAYDRIFQDGFFTEKIGLLKRIKYSIRASCYEKAYAQIKEMEKDEEYFSSVLEDKYKLSEEEQKLNPGDRYRLISPRDMRESARAYRRYKRSKK